MSKVWSRREFIGFMGLSGFAGCRFSKNKPSWSSLSSGVEDEFRLLDDFSYKILISWGDVINSSSQSFGFNNDFIAFTPDSKDEAWLWVNHEYPDPLFIHGHRKPLSLVDVEKEQRNLGGSILKIKRTASTWSWIPNHPDNRRIDALSSIPIISDRPIANSRTAIGSFGNCGGGQTPWGNILSCEENYDEYYGERESEDQPLPKDSVRSWAKFLQRPPEHYGWVMEVNPRTGGAKKLTSMGRFAHESATLIQTEDGRCVVYLGDDAEDECLYKFIADKPGSLEKGQLYVADIQNGKWLSLSIQSSEILRKNFKDQTDILIHTRRAAHLLGATKLHRPEDIEIHPKTKDVYVALTNHTDKLDFHGSILRVREKERNPLSLEFEASTFLSGGEGSGFACPDNLCFDQFGNLWMTTDVSVKEIGKAPYQSFGNNSLFFIPMNDGRSEDVIRVASGPVGSELTGPCFSPDGRHLFLSVQHPGEKSESLEKLTSHWPHSNEKLPRPSVVVVDVPLEKIKKFYGGA